MEIKPIKLKKKQPHYPTLKLFIENPTLLEQHIPVNWRKNTLISGALATFVLCGTPTKSGNPKTHNISVVHIEQKNKLNNIIKRTESGKEFSVAPIFAHGDGSGATGCVVMSPPVFISEEEALKIITTRLKKEGISFDTSNTSVINFKSRQIAISCTSDAEIDKKPMVDVEIKFDGQNQDLNLVFEYISEEDYFKYAEKDNLWGCSVTSYRTKKAAELLQQELVKDKKYNAVVFYDPIPSVNYNDSKDWDKNQKHAKEEAKNLLLAQVEDFIKWLKKSDILKQ